MTSSCSTLRLRDEVLYNLSGEGNARVYLFGNGLDAAQARGQVQIAQTGASGEVTLRFLGNTLLHLQAQQPATIAPDRALALPPTNRIAQSGTNALLRNAADRFRKVPQAWSIFRRERGCPMDAGLPAELLLSGALVETGANPRCAFFTDRQDALSALSLPAHPSRRLADAVAGASGEGLSGVDILSAVLASVDALATATDTEPAPIRLGSAPIPIIKETPATRYTLMLGPIPVEIQTGANGELRAGWQLDTASRHEVLSLVNGLKIPRLIAYDQANTGFKLASDFGAYTRAGVNLLIVQVGIDGKLQLVKQELAANLGVSLFSDQKATGLVQRTAYGPNGKLLAYAKWYEPVLAWREQCWQVLWWRVCVHLPELRWEERRANTTLANFPGSENRSVLLNLK
jgi:hypothetical protein